MKIIDRKHFEFGINFKWHGKFYWMPKWSGALDNFHKVENGKDFKFINTWSYFTPRIIQLFFMNLIIYLTIKPELISGKKPSRYVKFENTHLSLMDIPEGAWHE